MKLRLVLLLVLVLALALAMLYLWGSPRLAESSPADRAEKVQAGTPLKLTFSQVMQADTVTSRLTTDPARQLETSWQGNTLVVSANPPWPSGQKVSVRLAAGAKAAGFPGLTIRREYRWSFTIENSLLAYLYPWDGAAQVYLIDPQSGESQQLTHSPEAVLDYDFSADGTYLYFTASQASGDSAIYRQDRLSSQVNTLLQCPRAICRSPKVSSTGSFLAYERTDLSGSQSENFPQVWLLPLGSGAAPPRLAGDPTHRTQQPDWSPSGLLSYYDSTQTAYVFQDLNDDAAGQVPDQAGIPGAWSPDGKAYVYPDVFNSPGTITSTLSGVDILPSTHLLQYRLADRSSQDLTVEGNLDDASPLFSPDGSHLAFARRYLDLARWTPGRQLWLMDADGTGARQLTQAPFYNHYDFAWSPDGRLLVYTRFNSNTLTEPPEIWSIQADGSGEGRLLVGGYAPRWIP